MPSSLDIWKLLAEIGFFLFGMLLIEESVKAISGASGSGQTNIPIYQLNPSKRSYFHPLYRFFRIEKRIIRPTDTLEAQNHRPPCEHGDFWQFQPEFSFMVAVGDVPYMTGMKCRLTLAMDLCLSGRFCGQKAG